MHSQAHTPLQTHSILYPGGAHLIDVDGSTFISVVWDANRCALRLSTPHLVHIANRAPMHEGKTTTHSVILDQASGQSRTPCVLLLPGGAPTEEALVAWQFGNPATSGSLTTILRWAKAVAEWHGPAQTV
jgi:hypothetical protein